MSVLPRGVCARHAWTMVFSWQPQSYKYNRKRTARSQGVRDAVRSPNKWRGTLIIGMGVDIAEVERIQGAIERYGEVFLKRVYTVREREYCRSPMKATVKTTASATQKIASWRSLTAAFPRA